MRGLRVITLAALLALAFFLLYALGSILIFTYAR